MNPIALAPGRAPAQIAWPSLPGSPAGDGAGEDFAALCGSGGPPVAAAADPAGPPDEDPAMDESGAEEIAVTAETGGADLPVLAAGAPTPPAAAQQGGAFPEASGEAESAGAKALADPHAGSAVTAGLRGPAAPGAVAMPPDSAPVPWAGRGEAASGRVGREASPASPAAASGQAVAGRLPAAQAAAPQSQAVAPVGDGAARGDIPAGGVLWSGHGAAASDPVERQASAAGRAVASDQPAAGPVRAVQGAASGLQAAPSVADRAERAEAPVHPVSDRLPGARQGATTRGAVLPSMVPVAGVEPAALPGMIGQSDARTSHPWPLAASAPQPAGQVSASGASAPVATAAAFVSAEAAGATAPDARQLPGPAGAPVVQPGGAMPPPPDSMSAAGPGAVAVQQQPAQPPALAAGAADTSTRGAAGISAGPAPVPQEIADLTGNAALPGDEPMDVELQDSGPATTAPGAALRETARSPEVQLASAARQITQAAVDYRGGEASLTLDPEELGGLRVTISRQNGETLIQILAERPDTADLMRRHADLLLRDLTESGVGQARLSFSSGGDARDGRAGAGRPPAAAPGGIDHAGGASSAAWSAPARPPDRARGLDMRV